MKQTNKLNPLWCFSSLRGSLQPQAGSSLRLLPDVPLPGVRDGFRLQQLPVRGDQGVHPVRCTGRGSGLVLRHRDESTAAEPAHTGHSGAVTYVMFSSLLLQDNNYMIVAVCCEVRGKATVATGSGLVLRHRDESTAAEPAHTGQSGAVTYVTLIVAL